MISISELPTQAREIVLEKLGRGGFVLNKDQPWKLTAAKIIAGEDVSLGELTEVFRALGVTPAIITGAFCVETPRGRIMCADESDMVRTVLLITGKNVDGCVLSQRCISDFQEACTQPIST